MDNRDKFFVDDKLFEALEFSNCSEYIREDLIRKGRINDYFKKSEDEEDTREPAYTRLLILISKAKPDYGAVNQILSFGANPDLPYKYFFINGGFAEGMTPLLAAIYKNDFKLVSLLLLAGANPNMFYYSESYGYDAPPLKLAMEINNEEIIKLLVEKGGKL